MVPISAIASKAADGRKLQVGPSTNAVGIIAIRMANRSSPVRAIVIATIVAKTASAISAPCGSDPDDATRDMTSQIRIGARLVGDSRFTGSRMGSWETRPVGSAASFRRLG